MDKLINFTKRNLKEVSRDPLIYIFCIGFPVVMLILFQIINKYSNGQTTMFELTSLIPAIIMFSYTFVMLTMALLVSKDKQTSFLKRLFSSPMKHYHFVIGYAIVGVLIGLAQTIICILIGYVFSLITQVAFISFGQILLLILSQLPILLVNTFKGILFGTFFNDKSAPGVCSVFISLSGVLGGCWMPLEAMGGFATFCKFLPFYPSVYIGKITTNAINILGNIYTFDTTAIIGIVTIFAYLIISLILTFVAFKKFMVNDN